ncbi:MAG: prolyl oligopeptidase family serine peptidase [Actinomycetota bacterium]
MADPLDEFPRQFARTRGFTLGVPRAFTVSPDGERVAFLRTRTGDDPVSCLWVFDTATGDERCVVDPRDLAAPDEEQLTDAERARRERARERSSGVTEFDTDRDVRRAVFTISGRMFLADLVEGTVRELTSTGPVDDPRLDASGERIAYVTGGALHARVVEGGDRVLAADDKPDVSWGLAEFVAAEEMNRRRGHWWSPDGSMLAAARVDEREVNVWHIFDSTDPASAPRPMRYPQAGTNDAVVTLHVFDVESGGRTDVAWDRQAFPYLGRFHWSEGGPPLALVVSRDQRTAHLLEIDPASGATTLVRETTDPAWVDVVFDVPERLPDGRVVEIVSDHKADTNRVTVDGEPVTPEGVQVRGVQDVSADGIVFRASQDPTEIHVWRWSPGGDAQRLTDEPGVHASVTEGAVEVLVSAVPDSARATAIVRRHGTLVGEIRTEAEVPVVQPHPEFLTLGERDLRAALLLPNGREPDGPLPVLMDPYGFPHGARVLKAGGMFVVPQWFADHGFAVLVVDGRGVDGRGPAWDREMKFDFTVALEDQVDALHAAAERFPFLDTSRVGIRGWSGGGYLSALAVLRRPDVFHAGVVGAPVTDARLYDTYYMERYLGHPDKHPDVYEKNSFVADAPKLERPMLLIHGLADDNVFVANTLRLSAALFEAGRRHELVLIPNATHLTRSEAVTENILRVQLDFLKRSLGV